VYSGEFIILGETKEDSWNPAIIVNLSGIMNARCKSESGDTRHGNTITPIDSGFGRIAVTEELRLTLYPWV